MSLTAWDIETMRPGRLRLMAALSYYRARLRRRWIQETLAVCGIAAGVSLLYATQVASTSLSGPVKQITGGLVGKSQVQLLARGPARFPESVYDEVVQLPGIVRAAPVLQIPGNVVGPDGHADITYLGADPRVVKLRGSLLQGFSVADAARQETVVLPEPVAKRIGVRVGDDIHVQIAGRTITLPVVVAGRAQIGSLVTTSIALVPLAYLQKLARARGMVTRILVQAEPGKVAAVEHELQQRAAGLPVDVRPSNYETTLFDQATRPWRQSSAIFSVLSALVGWLFAVCAMLVSAAERRGLAREQRELGYPPRATLQTFLLDAAILGGAGVVVGLAVGEAISRHGFESDLGFLSGAFPIGDQRIVTWQSVAIAAAGGLAAALVGVLGPLHGLVRAVLPRSLRMVPRAAPARAPQRLPSWTLLCGCAGLAGAVAITERAPGSAVVGLVLLGISMVLLLPLILGWVVGGLRRFNDRQRTSIAVVLALQQLRSLRWRTRALAITTTGAIAVFGATALQGARENLQAGLDSVVSDLASASPAWVFAPGAGSVFGTSEFPATEAADLRALPAVRSVELYRAGLLDIDGGRAWVIGQPTAASAPVPPTQLLEGDVGSASARIRAGGWAVISHGIAQDRGLHVGDRFELPSPRPLTLRVAAVMTNLGWSGGAVLLNADDYRRAAASDDIAAYHVALRTGVTPDRGRELIAARLGSNSPLLVETAQQRVARQGVASHSGLARLRQIAQLTLLAAVLAMVAAMTALLWQHRPVVADLKLNGLSTRVMWHALIVETAVLLGTGAVAGGLFGLLGQLLCTRGIQVVTGFPVVEGLRLGVAGITVGAVVVASVVAMAVPGYLVAKIQPDWDEPVV
jgi:putative ABC transport system permease protein